MLYFNFLITLICIIIIVEGFKFSAFNRPSISSLLISNNRLSSSRLNVASDETTTSGDADAALVKEVEEPSIKALTQKEYMIAVRNRLFAVEEQIWLHEHATARGDTTKVSPLSDKKYDELLRARGELLDEYPITKLYIDLKDAQQQNLTYAAILIERLIQNFKRKLPLSMNHVNQIAVLSYSGQVVNLMRGQGALHHRLLPSNVLTERGVKRQFQHPAFSSNGDYVAFAEMHFKDTGIVRSDALVFEVPTDPAAYGASDSMPVFDSGDLPGAPFFLRFSPDDESLTMLCTSPNNVTGESQTSLVQLDWGRYSRKDSWAGQAAVSRFVPRKTVTLMQGSPVFFTYTTSSPKNATIVAHCQKEVEDSETKTMKTHKAVWMLDKQDTGGVCDHKWTKLCESDPAQRWSTPICHSAGGGDSVLVVEDGYLVSKALSRWKRNVDGAMPSKKLLKIQGQVQFFVSPDSTRAVVLQEDINIGHYSLVAIEGESALDPSSDDLGKIYELPNDKLTVAFWFSPDSSKILCLNAAGKSREDVSSQKSTFRVGLNSDMQWSVYNFPLEEIREYDTFKPTPYFMKTYVPFFSQYGQVYNPWAPDSRSFIYITNSGLHHTPLVGSKHSVGEGKWTNQGATFGTWSRM